MLILIKQKFTIKIYTSFLSHNQITSEYNCLLLAKMKYENK